MTREQIIGAVGALIIWGGAAFSYGMCRLVMKNSGKMDKKKEEEGAGGVKKEERVGW